MSVRYELRHCSAGAVFDLVDVFAQERGVRGEHPAPFGPIRFYVVARVDAGARRPLVEMLEAIVRCNTEGYHVFSGRCIRPGGERRVLPEGTYAVRIESRFYQPAECESVVVPTPASAYPVRLQPGYGYPFPEGTTLLRGSIHTPDGSGISGAVVRAAGLGATYRTDDTGQWVLAFPATQASGDVTVLVELPDGTRRTVANVPIVQEADMALPQTALRGWVRSGAGAGLGEAEIEVTAQGSSGHSATRSDGSWFYYFDLNQTAATAVVRATLQDGRSVTRNDVQVRPRATVSVPSFRFT